MSERKKEGGRERERERGRKTKRGGGRCLGGVGRVGQEDVGYTQRATPHAGDRDTRQTILHPRDTQSDATEHVFRFTPSG